MEKGIFKAYDVRGVYPQEIDRDAAYRIGRALITHTKAEKVVVGWDMRSSSPELTESLIEGMTDQGASVLKIGLTTTHALFCFLENGGN